MEKDVRGTLTAVRSMGYDCVEPAGLCGLSAADFRSICDDLGLKISSTHTGLPASPEALEACVADHIALGTKYMAIPWMRKESSAGEPDYPSTQKRIAATIAAFKKAGLQLLYHNHDFEFEKIGDEYKLDYMLREFPDLWPEFDCCWVRFAGEDPAKYIRKYAGKVPIVHLKDFISDGYVKGEPVYELIGDDSTKGRKPDRSTFQFRPIGQGCQDIPGIVAACEASGTHTLIVEQDLCHDLEPLEAARQSRSYLASIGL
jgi:sugar phosphate isomerase/epimerase